MLDHIWVIPAIMAVSFALILFFGKRTPMKGADLGLLAVGSTFVLSLVALIQWIQLDPGAAGEGAASGEAEHALRVGSGIGRFLTRFAEAEGEASHGLREAVQKGVDWFSIGPTNVRLDFHVDGVTVVLLFVVAFISLMVHIFSVEYMRDDRRFTHYYASLSLFTGAMYLMVSGANMLLLLFGWELMGLCSFLLIGHWWEEKDNTNAALKAMFTTRTGDIGLLVGMSILYFAAGRTFDIRTINEKALNGEISHLVLLVAACALFAAVIGKSAQFPLHPWLPDAMAGPTPASSLIHAATMVVAGVYLMVRVYGVFWTGFSIQAGGVNFGALIGATTIVMAAMLAFVQDDIKRVLAYSTVSQLGYMVMGLSVGAWTGALFHLVTHAFFKCLLFQCAGSIAHSGSHHSFDMKKSMGGLRKYMPITFATWCVGTLALSGIPIFAGFWSKDEILLGAQKNGFTVILLAGALGAMLTAAYMTRATYLTFFGEYRGGHAAHAAHAAHDAHVATDTHDVHDSHDAHAVVGHALVGHDAGHGAGHDAGHGAGHDAGHDAHGDPHESNWWILTPLVTLAVMSAFVGIVNAPWFDYRFAKWTENETLETILTTKNIEHPFAMGPAATSVAIACLGLLIGYFYNFVKKSDLGMLQRSGLLRTGHTILKNKYYLDHLETGVVAQGLAGPVARLAYWINQEVIDRVVNSAGKGAVGLGRFVYENVDQRGVDGVVNGTGIGSSSLGQIIRKIQTGKVQNYAALFLGAAGLASLALVLFV